jgi:hypothetical protein
MAKKKKRQNDWKHLITAGSIVVAVVGTLIIAWVLQSDPSGEGDRMVIERTIPDHQPPAPAPRTDAVQDGEILLDEETEAAAEPVTGENPPRAMTAPPPAPDPVSKPPSSLSSDLQKRADDDLARMRAAGAGYTLQFATLCSPESAESALDKLHDYDSFYIIPITSGGRRCHRLCWGIYRTRESAMAARGIPGALTAIEKSPLPKALDKVVP